MYLNIGDIWNNCCALYIVTATFFTSILPDDWNLSLYYSKERTLFSSKRYCRLPVERQLFLTITIFFFFLLGLAFMLNTFSYILSPKHPVLKTSTTIDFISDFLWFQRTFLLLLLLQLFSQNMRTILLM